jgi:hypothetical protein
VTAAGNVWCQRIAVAGTVALLSACSPPLPIHRFADTTPAFDPITFFTGHEKSWGVLENRGGAPTGIVATDCFGTAEGADGLHMVQHVFVDGKDTLRDWHMRRTGRKTFEATANDMVGTAHGEAQGRVFHWTWVLATKPGSSLRNVLMDQWMYYQNDGSMVNRTTISKLGIIVAEVTEQFERAP